MSKNVFLMDIDDLDYEIKKCNKRLNNLDDFVMIELFGVYTPVKKELVRELLNNHIKIVKSILQGYKNELSAMGVKR